LKGWPHETETGTPDEGVCESGEGTCGLGSRPLSKEGPMPSEVVTKKSVRRVTQQVLIENHQLGSTLWEKLLLPESRKVLG
jgi:hypothetical protein